MEWVPARLDGTGWELRALQMECGRTGVVAGTAGVVAGTAGVVAGIPGMDAHPVTRFRAETAHRTDLEGEGKRRVYLLKDEARIAANIAKRPDLLQRD